MEEALGQALDAVGPRLRTLRQARQATLTEVSKTTGISVSTLSRLESGSSAADALNCFFPFLAGAYWRDAR